MRSRLLVFLCLLLPGTALSTDSTRQLQLLVEQQEYLKAARAGDEILQQQPDNLHARFLTAYGYQMSGNTEKAITLYEELIRDHPTLPEPRNNLAMIYLEQGDYDRASQMLVSAINTRISYAIAYANLSQVYKGIASEAYRRAVSQSTEPAEYKHDIELTAITWLDAEDDSGASGIAGLATAQASPQAAIDSVSTENLLIAKVLQWAQAWSEKDFDGYRASYADGYSAKFDSHRQWVDYRRKRILRPGDIKVEVSDFKVRKRGDDRASVDFTQAFSSPNYKDRVVKRLDFERYDSQWKIASERVLSVL